LASDLEEFGVRCLTVLSPGYFPQRFTESKHQAKLCFLEGPPIASHYLLPTLADALRYGGLKRHALYAVYLEGRGIDI